MQDTTIKISIFLPLLHLNYSIKFAQPLLYSNLNGFCLGGHQLEDLPLHQLILALELILITSDAHLFLQLRTIILDYFYIKKVSILQHFLSVNSLIILNNKLQKSIEWLFESWPFHFLLPTVSNLFLFSTTTKKQLIKVIE